MKVTFSAEFMLSNRGCYDREKIKSLIGENKEISINDVLNWDIPLKDKAWFIRGKCELTTDQLREFAIGAALCVLPIYESKHPENKAPREAIEAAQAYLRKEITIDELLIKRRAAWSAAAYAAAAYDAADAAAAAAAYAAAYAAADAAYAAAYAAYAKGVNYKELLLTFFKKFMSNE